MSVISPIRNSLGYIKSSFKKKPKTGEKIHSTDSDITIHNVKENFVIAKIQNRIGNVRFVAISRARLTWYAREWWIVE